MGYLHTSPAFHDYEFNNIIDRVHFEDSYETNEIGPN